MKRPKHGPEQILDKKVTPTNWNKKLGVVCEYTMKSSLGQSRPDLPVPPNRGKFQSDTERLSADVGGLEVSLLQMVSDHQYASLKLRENSG